MKGFKSKTENVIKEISRLKIVKWSISNNMDGTSHYYNKRDYCSIVKNIQGQGISYIESADK